MIGGSSVAAHDRRNDRWKEEKKTYVKPTDGGLLGPMPTPAPAGTKAKPKKKVPTQPQIKHRWSYTVLWYEEIRRHTPAGFGIGPIEFPAIESYCRLMWIDIEPFEVELLMKLDLVWRASLPKEKPRTEK